MKHNHFFCHSFSRVFSRIAFYVFSLLFLCAMRLEAKMSCDFPLGADISWDTYLQDEGIPVKDGNGNITTSHELTQQYGLDAIRLRVFVDPTAQGGYCEGSGYAYSGKEDVLKEAAWATEGGQKLMIDFHLSDNWCDPGKQVIPSAWKNVRSIEELASLAVNHVDDVLSSLKKQNADVEWVQIGNETRTGFMKEWCEIKSNDSYNFNFVFNAVANKVKEIYPNAKTILMLDNGASYDKLAWTLSAVGNTLQYDLLGISMYPVGDDNTEGWRTATDNCVNAIKKVYRNFNKRTIICETGMPSHWTNVVEYPQWNDETDRNLGKKCMDDTEAFIRYFINELNKTQLCDGLFYWEPTIHELTKSNNSLGYQYGMGALDFDHNAKGFWTAINDYEYSGKNVQNDNTASTYSEWYLTGEMGNQLNWELREENRFKTTNNAICVVEDFAITAHCNLQITNSDWSEKYGSEEITISQTDHWNVTGSGGAFVCNLPNGIYKVEFNPTNGAVHFSLTQQLSGVPLINIDGNNDDEQAKQYYDWSGRILKAPRKGAIMIQKGGKKHLLKHLLIEQ